MSNYDGLRERALANFETLLNYWNISYTKINDDEFDFINPTRDDKDYGACRFNVSKGTGADFSGANFTVADYERIGPGFTAEDFAGLLKHGQQGWGFDVIGLTQKLHGCTHYSDAAKLLRKQLAQLGKQTVLNKAIAGAKDAREHARSEQKHKTLKAATKTWGLCSPFKGTIGEKYLISRKLYLSKEPNIKFHAKVYNKELNFNIPALLFQVQVVPDGPLVAIHRIYLAKDGSRKAKLDNPKMALGSIKGAAIWFGDINKQLTIVEGPENALTARVLGYPFVACTINSTNFHNVVIPDYVEELILMPDPDPAGKTAAHKAAQSYGPQVKSIKIIYPPTKKLSNGKYADLNDILCDRGGDGAEEKK